MQWIDSKDERYYPREIEWANILEFKKIGVISLEHTHILQACDARVKIIKVELAIKM